MFKPYALHVAHTAYVKPYALHVAHIASGQAICATCSAYSLWLSHMHAILSLHIVVVLKMTSCFIENKIIEGQAVCATRSAYGLRSSHMHYT